MQLITERLKTYLHINQMDSDIQHFAVSYFKVDLIRNFSLGMVSTFLVLYFLDIVTIKALGILIAIRFLIQTIFDYPTGSLGDIIGQRNVLIIAFVGHIISIIIFLFSTAFQHLLAGIIIQAISNSQESGALLSWFDNNYRGSKSELESRLYSQFMGKMQVLTYVITGTAIILGGLIATSSSRFFLLVAYLFLLVSNLMIILRTINGHETIRDQSQPSYLHQFTLGIRFFLKEKGILYYYVGVAFLTAAGSGIWYELMLFPYYQSYSGSDFMTGMLRSTVFLLSAFLSYLGVRLINKIKNLRKSLFIHYLLANPIWFSIILIYTQIFPPEFSFVLSKFLGIILIHLYVTISITVYTVLDKRLQLEIIPGEIRNSMYSITPTLFAILGIIFAFFGGLILGSYGFAWGLSLVIFLSIIGMILIGVGLRLFTI
ncbi:MAG: MFS transporter [Candidatus Heimdallarchaeota archaeon]|nr:MFS transporter [Candidatus Heimdallarchaeota archaeon]